MQNDPKKKKLPWPAWLVLWPFALVWLILKKAWDIISTVLGALWSLLTLPFRPRRPEPTGADYEFCAAAWLAARGYRQVTVTRLSGDYGVDILARRHGRRWAVQCKLYNYPVGVKAIQEVAAGMAHYDCNRAMVITNSTFTKAAQTLADDTGIELIENVPYSRRLEQKGRRLCGSSGSGRG